MAQAIMDPDEVRRFAKELKRFNDELQVKSQSLNARFTALSDTWKDQENQKFAEEFVGTMKALKKFIEISEKHTPFLLRKAQRIEEYWTNDSLMDQRQAKVTSVDALAAFRSSLVIYLSSARNALDGVRDEVRRTRTWLQLDQKSHWQGQLKRLRKQLEQAESELFTSRLSAMTSHSAARQMAVTRLRRKVRETEEKASILKKWIRNYDSLVEPLLKKLERVQHLVSNDLPKAVAFLSQAERTLDDYTRIAPEGDPAGEGGEGPESEGKPGEVEGGES